MNKFKMTVLGLSLMALFYAGSTRLIHPADAFFLRTFDGPDITIDLLNEIRGVGAVMVLGGIIASIGIFIAEFRPLSFATTSMIFTGITIGRTLSFFVDGISDLEWTPILITESLLAMLNIICLWHTLFQNTKPIYI